MNTASFRNDIVPSSCCIPGGPSSEQGATRIKRPPPRPSIPRQASQLL